MKGWFSRLADLSGRRTSNGFGERPLTLLAPDYVQADRPGPVSEIAGLDDAAAYIERAYSASEPGFAVAAPFPKGTGPEGHRERMRDRLIDRGPEGLADYELLEMLLFFAQPKGDTKPVAKALMNRFGSFAGVLAATPADLVAMPRIGRHSVAAIKLVQAAALRMARAELADRPLLNNWEKLLDYLTAAMALEPIEQVRVLFLDTRNRLIADEVQSRGTVNHTPVYPREIVKRALMLNATALVLVHNHPSGDPSPSKDDIAMTREVQIAAEIMQIMLHDHIIVGANRCHSFRQSGAL